MAELPVADLLSVAQAIQIIDSTTVFPRIEPLHLAQATGFRIAQNLFADRDYPPFDKSVMDGFAVRAVDVKSDALLVVVGDIPAGTTSPRGVETGQAMSIMTGAPLPDGADAVVPVEQTTREGDYVLIHTAAKPGQSVAKRGSDCAAGQMILEKGARLGPAQIAAAASVGAGEVKVFARPKVAVLSTGDEIVPVETPPGSAQIRNSNSYMLVALLSRLGCEVRDLGIVSDKPEAIRARMEEGMQDDALFVTGGMSMGAYDYVPNLLIEMGVLLRITKLRIKPGKPFVFGIQPRKDRDRFVFGLPGNPVSAFVCTLLLASRLLDRLGGGDPSRPFFDATLRVPLPANGPREFYLPGNLDSEGGVTPLAWKGSADIYTLAAADVLIVRGENDGELLAGAQVRAMKLPI